MQRRLILLRHGQTSYNATKRMQGQYDSELSDHGRAQAETVARHFASRDMGITKIVASDLQRATETAQIIGRELGLDVTQDARMRETHLGQWQQCSHAEVDGAYPGARVRWRHDPEFCPPGGESRVQVAARTSSMVYDLMDSYADWDGHTVLLVAHGGAIGALTARLLELPVPNYPLFNGLKNTAWSQLLARPRFTLGDQDSPDTGNAVVPDDLLAQQSPAGQLGELRDDQWYLEAWNAQVMP